MSFLNASASPSTEENTVCAHLHGTPVLMYGELSECKHMSINLAVRNIFAQLPSLQACRCRQSRCLLVPPLSYSHSQANEVVQDSRLFPIRLVAVVSPRATPRGDRHTDR